MWRMVSVSGTKPTRKPVEYRHYRDGRNAPYAFRKADMNIAQDRLEYLKERARYYKLVGVCQPVLDDPRFVVWSGSSKPFQHHYGRGGLVTHISEVVKLMLQINMTMDYQLFDKHLFLAGLFHDVGKMWDYEPLDSTDYKEWRGTAHKRHIHHITRSGLVWMESAKKDMPTETQDDVLHAILAHHGRREAGSPVYPATKLAWILHFCDGISARMNDADKCDYLSEVRGS